MLTVDEALQRIVESIPSAVGVSLPLQLARNCVLAADVRSGCDSPPFDKAMMDGFAIRSLDLVDGKGTLAIIGEVAAGAVADRAVGRGEALRIMTGAPIPAGVDAVVPVEWTTTDSTTVRIQSPGKPVGEGLNIVRQGTAMSQGEVILSAGRRLLAPQLALLAEAGIATPYVRRPPRVAILATGNELVPVDQIPGPGEIRNTNALMLAAQLQQFGATPIDLGIARDERESLREKIAAGLQADFFVLSGGVSAGTYDLVPSELQAAGVREVFHKIAMKPGKPLWFGIRSGAGASPCAVFGLPGNPVSSLLGCELFLRTAIRAFVGLSPAVAPRVVARLAVAFSHKGDRETWYPARLSMGPQGMQVSPVNWKGSFDLRSPADANCSVRFTPGDRLWEAGTEVEVLVWGGSLES
ncbi:molybdopterin molybdotransferase MoeA [Planctomicrobium sp. SH664]|uniref:molybdopterin molybdotransferase MoeA n=1 Tax=Planctomicrobium sp. SH664 TaxID=3448125 RepID=UPI003F5BE480